MKTIKIRVGDHVTLWIGARPVTGRVRLLEGDADDRIITVWDGAHNKETRVRLSELTAFSLFAEKCV